MKNSTLADVKSKVLQRGVAAVEFALIAIPFLLLLLGAMEFGRLLYLWNTAQEVTRNAARQAVVTDFTDYTSNTSPIATVRRNAVFRATDGFLPASSEIANANVVILYLNAEEKVITKMPDSPGDNIAACLDASRSASCIRYVEVCLSRGNTCSPAQTIAFKPMIGLFSGGDPNSPDLSGIRIPLSTVRMPAESLGFNPVLED